MHIGTRIRELRKMAGMTQAQLAEKLCVSRQTVSKWEAENSLPDLMSCQRLCGIVQLTLDELAGEAAERGEGRMTLEDLCRLNRRHRERTALFLGGVLLLMGGGVILAAAAAVKSAALSTQYLLYRAVVAGEYAAAPMHLGGPLASAGLLAAAGAGLLLWGVLKGRM